MKEISLVLGGCKSGKTSLSLDLARGCGAPRKTYIATCVPTDGEMMDRVEKHQAERGNEWATLEQPLFPDKAIASASCPDTVVVVDCLTLWLSNLLAESSDEEFLYSRWFGLVDSLKQAPGPVICVSNEVGAGIVPENALARKFRDLAGLLNQQIAAAADRVVWMAAGIPVVVKGENLP